MIAGAGGLSRIVGAGPTWHGPMMDPDFWRARWREGRIGFHQAEINPHLQKWRPQIEGRGRVLVPLAGKSRDLSWLAQSGEAVIGVELVEDAVRAFFDEQSLSYQRQPGLHGVRYEGAGIVFWAGDFFALPKEALGGIDWIYDRAAAIALPPALRERYVVRVAELLQPGQEILLVALEHDPALGGPPFHVDRAEVERLYQGHFAIEELERVTAPPDNPKFRDAGLEWLTEVVYRLVRR